MKNIGLSGGTFNPVRNDHLHIARALTNKADLDAVVFLPAGGPYHRPQAMQTSAVHRLATTELAVAESARFAVSDRDIVRDDATYTFDTAQIFRQQFPAARLQWLLGSDSLMKSHAWKKWQTLVKQTHIVVAMREGGSLGQIPCELHAWLGEVL